MSRFFKPVAWSYFTNIYEVNLRQYTPEGTFTAFAAHLPRLQTMGVETLWFMPITPISVEKRLGTLGSYYASSDYKTVNPEYGTMDDFRHLVNEAHAMGFKVIIDWVANHTGYDHVWTKSNPEFYKQNERGEFYDNHGWTDVIDLNYYDHAMRSAMVNAMEFWVTDCNIDGFRCDMAHLVPLDFWRHARRHLDRIRPLFWLAETENVNYLDVFDCCYAWQWMHYTTKYIKGEVNVLALKELLHRYEKDYPDDSFHLFFTTNHDENSWNGTEYEKYGDAAYAFAVFSCTWHGLPLIYSGQELPNRKRLLFFEKDVIEWHDHPAMEDFYRRLLLLRKRTAPAAGRSAGTPEFVPTNVDQYVMAYVRRFEGKVLLVLLNLSPNHLFVQIPDGYVHGNFTDVFSGTMVEIVPRHSFEMKPWGYLVLEK